MKAQNSAINLYRFIGGTAGEMAEAASLGWRALKTPKTRRNKAKRRAKQKAAKRAYH